MLFSRDLLTDLRSLVLFYFDLSAHDIYWKQILGARDNLWWRGFSLNSWPSYSLSRLALWNDGYAKCLLILKSLIISFNYFNQRLLGRLLILNNCWGWNRLPHLFLMDFHIRFFHSFGFGWNSRLWSLKLSAFILMIRGWGLSNYQCVLLNHSWFMKKQLDLIAIQLRHYLITHWIIVLNSTLNYNK